MNIKWSSLPWKSESSPDINNGEMKHRVGVVFPASVNPSESLLRQLSKTLENGEKIEDIKQRLRQAIEVGATSLDAKELLKYLDA